MDSTHDAPRSRASAVTTMPPKLDICFMFCSHLFMKRSFSDVIFGYVEYTDTVRTIIIKFAC